ncbi:transposase [Mesorhizobium sp.]|uniref:transposase n=1 Tax=Mesorhizobium sp. TaxID=1871066 RepID=UPI000FCC2022|nr:hypothetical protein EOA85_13555 [Mesorhizobium sp. M5C.F.Ca.IN.020.29.1.1]RWA95945.1 MAG: hypothetical protein EOQ33_33960 [Mesorhizobium sp.]TGT92590.1 hypothetical protein EN807_31925 [Mesorhizobium sp. M5C.F.Ca.ET.164.01.1.1]RWC17719.1 MAG: hypothetical protein EOS51_17630 [Mesorhizobium sp.]RWD74976.1 MAG: hypothetical protein EOS48_32315 [Mesorhizobium sp.]
MASPRRNTAHQIEVITSVERRRRWSREEKERLSGQRLSWGPGVSELARSAGTHVSQLFPVAQGALPDLRAARCQAK